MTEPVIFFSDLLATTLMSSPYGVWVVYKVNLTLINDAGTTLACMSWGENKSKSCGNFVCVDLCSFQLDPALCSHFGAGSSQFLYAVGLRRKSHTGHHDTPLHDCLPHGHRRHVSHIPRVVLTTKTLIEFCWSLPIQCIHIPFTWAGSPHL